MRQQFAFYKSFDDVYQDLSDKQKIEFMDTLLDVQFLRIKIEDVMFKDTILKHIWNAQKHSLDKSVKGYLESQKNTKIKEPFMGCYGDNFLPLQTPSEGIYREEQEKEEVKEQEKDKKEFSFTLKKLYSFENLSNEYKSKLEEYIGSCSGMSYKDFENSCVMKGYKYKNFKMAYDKWGKSKTDTKPEVKAWYDQ
ncbi:MAG: hypothetical protein OQL19_18430 [Gammaproteobacteria bacterium]|nr:hypothetical protein [Gammaproteobacteria bacterium]